MFGLAALAAASLSHPLHAADIKAARVWAGSEYTRVVFDLSGPQAYTLSRQDGAVVLDLAGCRTASGFGAPAAQGLYKGLGNSRQGPNLRLVARTAANAQPKAFLLKPSGEAGYRLVLDLYPDAAAKADGAKPVAAAPSRGDATPATPAVAAPPPASIYSAKASRSGVLSSRQAAALLQGDRKVVVAIDAGHGGKDTGARGATGAYEKNVTLAVARNLAAQINRQPGMKAVLTRDGDYFIPLQQRWQIARDNKADLFVSIHADAFINSDARGSSVWVLSSRGKSNTAARWLADRENGADLIGGVSLSDMDDNLAAVVLDLQQGWAVQASEAIAGNVLRALGQLGPTHRGYVERANFVVLRAPDVPSILVETAFITNPDEERKLKNESHQEALATAVMGGVKNYFESTPPPGTWFAAQAARRSGVVAAAAAPTRVAGKASLADRVDEASPADAGVRDLHRVGRGESLRSIARQYGVSVGALKTANGIQSDSVHVGAMLSIPSG
ncbi:N-acetylmuramoyl-L-alanine amidase [Frateuria defendens]|uniref:N-acetylmuramoyl-L-alanine amidase n=1 Tax=Frateuria defendens TaxID=2219559 RepID=UPI00066FDFD6|nr:N-acetylmuramoyl-L-alanine amidase [Frateuria defendens]